MTNVIAQITVVAEAEVTKAADLAVDSTTNEKE